MDAVKINSVSITPSTVNAGGQFTIIVDALFFRPIGAILFDATPYDRGIWLPDPE